MVLGKDGGALSKMLPPFKLGLGGILGDGSAYMSWISLDDLIGVIQFGMAAQSLSGPVNATAPAPVSNREFTKTLGKTLGRPTCCPMPAFAVRLLFGEMGRELLLASTRALPARLLQADYPFQHPQLEDALQRAIYPAKK